jgi:hypothetical protein
MKLFGNFKHEAIWFCPEEGKKVRVEKGCVMLRRRRKFG